MNENVAFSIGNLALIDKANAHLGGEYFEKVFGGIKGRAKDFVPSVKLFMYNRMGQCLSVNRLTSYPIELFNMMGFKEVPASRSLNRMIERVGMNHAFILEEHQRIIKQHDLVSDIQFADFSSSYFEGKAEEMGERGYSRDGLPGKKQIVFGICTGINGIPTALTIQKGNVQDKKHFRFMLRTAEAVLEANSILIYDCGANTEANKKLVRAKGFHFLTLKAKKVGPYRKYIALFNEMDFRYRFEVNGRHYECVKLTENHEVKYLFYSKELEQEQLRIKQSKFSRELEDNDPLLKRTLRGKPLGEYPCKEGTIIAKGSLQKAIDDVANPHVNGVEGFFILESSIDADPEAILRLYKERDKAEKFIRNIKEGTELRPMRHWSRDAIIGYVVLVFLTNFLINLSLLKAKRPIIRNVKLLKKYLMSLTFTVVYPPEGFRYHILANVTDEIKSILGDFIDKYQDKSLRLRW